MPGMMSLASHVLGPMIYGYTLLVPMNQKVLKKLCFTPILLLCYASAQIDR